MNGSKLCRMSPERAVVVFLLLWGILGTEMGAQSWYGSGLRRVERLTRDDVDGGRDVAHLHAAERAHLRRVGRKAAQAARGDGGFIEIGGRVTGGRISGNNGIGTRQCRHGKRNGGERARQGAGRRFGHNMARHREQGSNRIG